MTNDIMLQWIGITKRREKKCWKRDWFDFDDGTAAMGKSFFLSNYRYGSWTDTRRASVAERHFSRLIVDTLASVANHWRGETGVPAR